MSNDGFNDIEELINNNVRELSSFYDVNDYFHQSVFELIVRRVFYGELISKKKFFDDRGINVFEGSRLYFNVLKDFFGTSYDNPAFYIKSVSEVVGVDDLITESAFELNELLGELNGYDPIRIAGALVYLAGLVRPYHKSKDYFESKFGRGIESTINNIKKKLKGRIV